MDTRHGTARGVLFLSGGAAAAPPPTGPAWALLLHSPPGGPSSHKGEKPVESSNGMGPPADQVEELEPAPAAPPATPPTTSSVDQHLLMLVQQLAEAHLDPLVATSW